MKKPLPMLLGLLVLTACSSENFEEPEPPNEISTKVPIEKALQNANDMLQSISNQTRSQFRVVESVEMVTSKPHTRSTAPDTLFYLVNYENDNGFALLSTDNRTVPIYAISDKGHLTLTDTIENPGLAIMLSFAEKDAIEARKQNLARIGGMEDSRWITTVIDPRLDEFPRNNWDQGWPYNRFINNDENAGCVAVAFALYFDNEYQTWSNLEYLRNPRPVI